MKYFTFYRENNVFDDILSDPTIKKLIDEKFYWHQHLMIGVTIEEDSTESYLTIKFGDDMRQNLIKDFSPVPGVDYIPERDIKLFGKDNNESE